jgi:PEP-CTERM/exosortase A-associated glycosyltransferase
MATENRMGTAIAQPPAGQTGCYRVLHVFDHSWPVLSGYSVRSRNLVRAQRCVGFEPVALTGPLHQLDSDDGPDAVVDGSHYLRTQLDRGMSRRAIAGRWPFLRESATVRLLRRRIVQLLDEQKFDIVHAHSPALCGLAAVQAAKVKGVPCVYEIRAFWEEGPGAAGAGIWRSLRRGLTRRLEIRVARHSDAVVGIAANILDVLRHRGIPRDKLFHVPNGVDCDRFAPVERDFELSRQLRLDGQFVFGFIGSLYGYEGISWLVSAMGELKQSGVSCKLLVAGEGEDLPMIAAAARQMGVEDMILALGRVPHDDVKRYYSLIDVMVYPRRKSSLTDTVTPLKPLEAMALGKPILGSDVGGMRELIDDEKTGLLFRAGQVDDFCRQARRLISDAALRRTLSAAARRNAVEEKDWKVLVRRYEDVYRFARSRYGAADV